MDAIEQSLADFDNREQAVLIIDDDIGSLKMLSAYLEELDFKILIARSGESGLEKAKLGRPNLILLDIIMPGIDGFETCRRLKENPDTKDIPVIFLSAKGQESEIQEGLEAGAMDYILKPFAPDELTSQVQRVLKQIGKA